MLNKCMSDANSLDKNMHSMLSNDSKTRGDSMGTKSTLSGKVGDLVGEEEHLESCKTSFHKVSSLSRFRVKTTLGKTSFLNGLRVVWYLWQEGNFFYKFRVWRDVYGCQCRTFKWCLRKLRILEEEGYHLRTLFWLMKEGIRDMRGVGGGEGGERGENCYRFSICLLWLSFSRHSLFLQVR